MLAHLGKRYCRVMYPRRNLLVGCAAALATSGCVWPSGKSRPRPDSQGDGCRKPGELVSFNRVGDAELRYAETGNPTEMQSAPGFLKQLNSWAEHWAELSGLGPLRAVSSFGAYVDKCASYHQLGRAFDVTALEHASGRISLAYDQFQPGSERELRDYWRATASLQLHFSYTLSYAYNTAHHNHVHVDNAVSGNGLSRFNENSRVQMQLLQNSIRHVLGIPTPDSEEWDESTREAIRQTQRAIGITDPLNTETGWHALLLALARG